MLIYGYRGKKCLVSTNENNNTNFWALIHYYDGNYNCDYTTPIVIRHIYNSYSTLCKFNNSLTSIYELNDEFIKNIEFVKEYLQNNKDIENSIDSKCRNIYDHLRVWYNRLISNPNCLNDIKWQVARTMKYYEKQEIFRISSINLKRNYYDFVL